MMEFSEFLDEIGKTGNHWIDYHIIMGKIRSYEKKYKIKIVILTICILLLIWKYVEQN